MFYFWCYNKVSCEKTKKPCHPQRCTCPFQLKAQIPTQAWKDLIDYDQSTSPPGVDGVEPAFGDVVEGIIKHKRGDAKPVGMHWFRWEDCKGVIEACPGTEGVTK